MAKKREKINKKFNVNTNNIILFLVVIITLALIFFVSQLNKLPENIPDSCLAQIASKECKTRGYTHSNVVRYDVEINKLLFTCLIAKEQPLVDTFVIEITKEKLNICDLD